MTVIAVIIGTLPLLGAVWLAVMHSQPGLAQSPTPGATIVTPGVSTASPSQAVVSPASNVAESTTESLTQGGDDDGGSSDITTGVIAGVLAGAAVIFAGIAYRLARGRPRAG